MQCRPNSTARMAATVMTEAPAKSRNALYTAASSCGNSIRVELLKSKSTFSMLKHLNPETFTTGLVLSIGLETEMSTVSCEWRRAPS